MNFYKTLFCTIQGPLSDSLNTASGITGDLLRIAKSLGASDKGRILKAKHESRASPSPR